MKKLFIIGGVFLFVILITIYVTNRPGGRETKNAVLSPSPALLPSVSTFENINFETASGSAIIARLGRPLRSDVYKGVTTYIYPTADKGRNISVEVDEGGSVKRIIEPILGNQRFASIASGLGAADLELYGTHEDLGFRLYVYLSRGAALLANPTTQEVRERWRFPVMSGGSFKSDLGVGFSTEYVAGKQ